ncbi:MAG: insulinase family protein, partial [Candidatus Aminicenantes bacterium]|nr:insulinase family protein [Candidatus Aminicenantes bacterium]
MKKISVIKFLLVVIMAASLSLNSGLQAKQSKLDKIKYPPLNKFELPQIKAAQTANGMKLRLIKNEQLPLIELEIMVRGGDVYDPADKIGLAIITAQLLRIGGTTDMQPDRLEQLLDAKGISIDCSSGDDFFTVSMTCLQENLNEAVSILAGILLQPAFDKEKLEEIKAQLKSAVSRRNDDPNDINSREFDSLIYGKDSPFAAVLEYKHIDDISMIDIAACYRSFFAPGNMLIGVIGPVEMDELLAIFEKYFAAWEHTARIPSYPTAQEKQYDFKVAFADKSNLNQSYLTIGHLGVKEDVADFKEKAKIKVFNSIFSSGFTSRLMTRVREKLGLTYGISGGIMTGYLYPGTIAFSTFTQSKNTAAAIRAIFDEIDIIKKEKVSEKELNDARNYFLNSYVFEFSSPGQILSNALNREFYGIADDFQENLIESIKHVGAADVLEVAAKYLHPEKMIVFVVGNEKEIGGDLAALGKVEKIDITIPSPPLKEEIPEAAAEMLAKGQQLITALATGKYRGYKSIKSLEVIGDASLVMGDNTFSLGTKSIALYPDKFYNEITIMGMKMEVIIDGDKGLMKQMGQERPLAAKDIAENRFSDLYFILNANEKYKFQYLKETEIEGKKYDVLYIFDAEKNWLKLYIDKKTGLVEIEEKLSD